MVNEVALRDKSRKATFKLGWLHWQRGSIGMCREEQGKILYEKDLFQLKRSLTGEKHYLS